jgi:hypothetical protein
MAGLLKTYGWDAVKLSNAYGLPELELLRQQLVNDPANQNPQCRANGGNSISLYMPATNKKLDKLAYAVQFVLSDKKELEQSRKASAK